MKKVVINSCFGGFGLSLFGQLEYAKLKGFDLFFYRQTKYEHSGGVNEYERIDDISQDQLFSYSIKKDLGKIVSQLPQDDESWFSYRDIDREDLHLIEVVEKHPDKVHGNYAKLKVVEIPSDIEYEIDEYDGNEHIAEVHRTWA